MIRRTLAALCCVMALSMTSICEALPADNFADAKTREIVGGRKVLITVIQNSILPTIYPPGGIYRRARTLQGVTATYATPLEIEREMQLMMAATQDSIPIFQAMQGYDFNGPLDAALRKVVLGSSWLRPQDIEFSEHGTTDFALDKLDESNTRQMLLLYTNYYTTPEFTAVVVELQIRLLVRKIPKGMKRAARINPKYIPYEQIIRSMVRLPDADLVDRTKNVARWAADDGRRVRAALDTGITDVAALAAVSLELDEDAAKDWRTRKVRKMQKIAGIFGWVREKDENALLMIGARDGTWTRIRTLGNCPPVIDSASGSHEP